jgi:hypothetical protein
VDLSRSNKLLTRPRSDYCGDKGSRDTLIELRLATDCMALDTRIFRILEKVGVKVSPADIFEQLERELVRTVAKPLGLSGAQLDRIMFGHYSRIVKADIGIRNRRKSHQAPDYEHL